MNEEQLESTNVVDFLPNWRSNHDRPDFPILKRDVRQMLRKGLLVENDYVRVMDSIDSMFRNRNVRADQVAAALTRMSEQGLIDVVWRVEPLQPKNRSVRRIRLKIYL